LCKRLTSRTFLHAGTPLIRTNPEPALTKDARVVRWAAPFCSLVG
jgi:hypothetical protein